MIELTIEEFVLWVVGVPLLSIGFYCAWTGFRRRAMIRRRKLRIFTCRVCGHLYEDRGYGREVRCPECGRVNERGGSGRLG